MKRRGQSRGTSVYYLVMGTEQEQLYKRCITCGRWIPEESRVAGRFCSETCSRRYLRCNNCGTYMERPGKSDETLVCSYCGAIVNIKDHPEKEEENAYEINLSGPPGGR